MHVAAADNVVYTSDASGQLSFRARVGLAMSLSNSGLKLKVSFGEVSFFRPQIGLGWLKNDFQPGISGLGPKHL